MKRITRHIREEDVSKNFLEEIMLFEEDGQKLPEDMGNIKKQIAQGVEQIDDVQLLKQILSTIIMVSGFEKTIKEILITSLSKKMSEKEAVGMCEYIASLVARHRQIDIEIKKEFFQLYANELMLISSKKLTAGNNVFKLVGEQLQANDLFKTIAPQIVNIDDKKVVGAQTNIGPGELYFVIFSSDIKKGKVGDLETLAGTKIELKGNDGRLSGIQSVRASSQIDKIQLIFKTALLSAAKGKAAIKRLPDDPHEWQLWTRNAFDVAEIFNVAGLKKKDLQTCILKMYKILYPTAEPQLLQISAKAAVGNNGVDPQQMLKYMTLMQFDCYKKHDNWDKLMLFDKVTGDYILASSVEEMEQLIDDGSIKISGGVSFTDNISTAHHIKIAKKK